MLWEEYRLRVFENRAQRRIFEMRRYEVMGEWRKQLNEELLDLYFLTRIIRIIKLRRMRWAGHVASMREKKNVHRWESQMERDCKEDQDGGGWIILGWILERWDGVMWTGLVWLRIGTGGELL
jgi:hypothetical protein